MRKFIGWVQIIFCSFLLFVFVAMIIHTLYNMNDPELLTNKYPNAGDTATLIGVHLVFVILLAFGIRNGIGRIKKKNETEDKHPVETSRSSNTEDLPVSSVVFRFNEDGLKQLRVALLKKIVPIFAFISLAVMAYSTYYSLQKHESMFVIIIPPILIAVVVVISCRRSVNQQIAILQTYTITLHTNYISREQSNLPVMEIANDEIESITKNSEDCIIIKGMNARETIYIPVQLEHIDKLEQSLSKIKEIKADDSSFFKKKAGIIAVIAVLALFATVIIATNRIVVCISGVILLIMMGYSLYKIQTNKSIDKKTKDTSWMLLLVAISIAYAIYAKLTKLP